MSIGIPGANRVTSNISAEAGFKTAHHLQAEGYTAAESHTIGEKAGAIGSMLTLRALEKLGLIDVGIIRLEAVFDELEQLERETGVREIIEGIWAADLPLGSSEIIEVQE